MDFWTHFIIISLISIVKQAVKNPEKRERLRGVLLNVRDVISAAYHEVPETE